MKVLGEGSVQCFNTEVWKIYLGEILYFWTLLRDISTEWSHCHVLLWKEKSLSRSFVISRYRKILNNSGGTYAEILREIWVGFISCPWRMDAFEGIHAVCISSSPPAVSTPSPGYELLVMGSKGIALYSNHAFFGKEDSSGHRQRKPSRAEKEECPVGK